MENRFLDIESVVENAMLSLDNVDSRDRVVFRQWAYIALRQIGFSQLNIRDACVDVCDLMFKKPCDLVSTIEVSLKDDSGLSIKYKYIPNKGLLPADATTAARLGCDGIVLSEDADFYFLSSGATQIASAEIKYYALPIDSNGDPMVPERDLLTVMSFIEYMYIKRKRISVPGSVSNTDLQEFRDIWIRELMKAKGRNKMPSIHQASAIAQTWMTMISKATYKN